MESLVLKNNAGKPITTSLIVAEIFGKDHKNVIRDIENLSCSDNFRVLNFEHTPYLHPQNGQIYKMYTLTKDGFTFLVMGYTGDKAGEFKERFINRFNEMEESIRSGGFQIPSSFSEALMLAAKQQEQLENANKQIKALTPKAELADKIMDTGDKIDIGQASKLLKLGYGRNTLFQKLRQAGIFFANRNEPKQTYIDRGYFEVKEVLIERSHHPSFTAIKVLVTQKGLAFINKTLGGSPSDGKMMPIK